MPITSLIISCAPGTSEAVAAEIAEMPYIEVTDVRDDVVIIITDTPDSDRDQETWDSLVAVPDVYASDIIYHNFEDVELESHAD